MYLRQKSPHATEPSVDVLGLLLEEAAHLGVRKNQELPLLDALQGTGGDCIRIEQRAHGREGLRRFVAGVDRVLQQAGAHGLRADHTDPDASVAVRDRQPFGQCHGRMPAEFDYVAEDALLAFWRGCVLRLEHTAYRS